MAALSVTVPVAVVFEGDNTATGNKAIAGFGGFLYAFSGSKVTINGRFCASLNSVGPRGGGGGGFAFIESKSSLLFSEGSQVNLGLNTPDAVATFTDRLGESGSVKCGTDNSEQWARDAAVDSVTGFNITGPACACNQQFIEATTTKQTCDLCASGWPSQDTEGCACVSAELPTRRVLLCRCSDRKPLHCW